MRILYFTERDSPHDQRFLTALGGTEHQVYSLRMAACNPRTPAAISELTWRDETPDWLCWSGWQKGISQLKDIFTSVQPNLVHAGPIQGPALAASLADLHPLVTMSWGFDLLRIADRSPWTKFATACTLNNSDLLLADCETVAKKAMLYGFSNEYIVRFPWGVDLEHFSPDNAHNRSHELRQFLGWEDKFVIFCNRAWSRPYGVDLLAKAFANAFGKEPGLRLILAGDGPQAEIIHKSLASVEEAVYFPGWVKLADLPRFYGAGDLFVSPSHVDGSSISLLEALACGRPVLTSDIPSNREWVIPGQTGELFTDGDVISLERMILSMAGKEDLIPYGNQARKITEERANWSANFQKLLLAYQIAAG